jgi:hypothetical protein
MKYEQQSKTSGLSDVQTLRKRAGSSSRPAESSESSTVQRFVPVKRRSLRKPNAWVRRGRKGPMPRYQSRDRPIDELISTLNRPTTGSFADRRHPIGAVHDRPKRRKDLRWIRMSLQGNRLRVVPIRDHR